MSMPTIDERRVDVVILTALPLEFDAVLQVDAGAVPSSRWERDAGPSGLPIAFRSFEVSGERPLRVAVAVSPKMGTTAATNTLFPLVQALKPRCIAMCGVCAGRKGKTRLGDVVAADRIFYHDSGKQLPMETQQDITTYLLRDDWKAALENLDVVAHFRDAAWFKDRPLTIQLREERALIALRDGVPEPWTMIDPTLDVHGWKKIVSSLRKRKLLTKTGVALTNAGRIAANDHLFKHMGALPDVSPAGTFYPFRLHVAPIGSGSRVIENDKIWFFISKSMRKTLGLEMEAAALGELAHHHRQYKLDVLVMKGVMDFADPGRDDHFKEFAARASAECLLWFLCTHIRTQVTPGFDDLLVSGTFALPAVGSSSGTTSPSLLLSARHAVVPWHDGGRSAILADLNVWADDTSRTVAVCLLHGEGGIGKTRLAIEWVRCRRGLHEAAGFLVLNPGERWFERLYGLGAPVLVVIDYAERRADLVEILERVAAFEATPGPRRRVRVLLLARGDGDWWNALPRRHGSISALLDSATAIKLSPLAATTEERETVFLEASTRFAELRGRSPVLRPPIELNDARFERVLYLHMAALAAIEVVAFDAGSLLDAVLNHEERFWFNESASRHAVAVDTRMARQLIVVATLRGGLMTEEEAREAYVRLAGRGRTRDDDVLITLLHDIYQHAGEGEATYLPSLRPDLLGEGMVLRVAAPPTGAGDPVGENWIERVFASANDARSLTTAFTVLGHASAIDAAAVRPWIAKLLSADLATRAVLALRAEKAVGQRTATSVVGVLLAEALEQQGSTELALDLDKEAIPHPTVSLQRVAAWRSRVLLESTPSGHETPILVIRARRQSQRSVDLAEMGQYESALPVAQECVNTYRTLETLEPDTLKSELARSLSNLGAVLKALGQRDAALKVTRESTEMYRVLATHNPDAFQPDLAGTLNNLGSMLSALNQHEAALKATEESSDLYRTLRTRKPDAFLPDLAASLSNHGINLDAFGRHEAALIATRDAARIWELLATRNPDAFLPDLAKCLHNLGTHLGDVGDHDGALLATRRAVELYRTLVMRNPDAFHPGLAMSLSNLGVRLVSLGQHDSALATAHEAVSLYRDLADNTPDAFEPDFAMSLVNLGNILYVLGQHDAALAFLREAADLYRMLMKRNSRVFEPALATSLSNLGIMLRGARQQENALIAISEAADLFRRLTTDSPEVYQPALAKSLSELATMLGDMRQHDAALKLREEAVDLYRMLVNRSTGKFGVALAMSVNNLANELSAMADHEAALAATIEAVGLYRELARNHPGVFDSNLAVTLNNMGSRLSESGQADAALAATNESVELYRALARQDPVAFEPGVAMSLNNLGIMLSNLGRYDAALAAAEEAVGLYRALARSNPDAFEAELAMNLYNLGSRLTETGQKESALMTTRESVDRYRVLAHSDPNAFQPALAKSLNSLGNRFDALSLHKDALAATSEAVDLYRALATRNPNEFQPALAMSLSNLGIQFSIDGQYNIAFSTARETVDLYRALAVKNANAFHPSLAMSLHNLGNRLWGLGQRETALDTTLEALDLIWPFFARYPTVHLVCTAAILRSVRVFCADLNREPSRVVLEREMIFAELSASGCEGDPTHAVAVAIGSLISRRTNA